MSSPVWGVELLYDTHFSKSGGGSLFVSLSLSKRAPHDLPPRHFFTNRFIHGAMENFSGNFLPLGSMRLNISRDNRIAFWESFYPYDRLHRDMSSRLNGIGIVQLAELHALLRLKKDFPQVKWVSHDITDHTRDSHLRSRGLVTRTGRVRYETFALSREIRLLRQKIAQDMWKHVPLPPPLNARLCPLQNGRFGDSPGVLKPGNLPFLAVLSFSRPFLNSFTPSVIIESSWTCSSFHAYH